MSKESDFINFPVRMTCSNCKLPFHKHQLQEGYKVDLKLWCHDCRIGKNHVLNKCGCTRRGCYCRVGFPWEQLCVKCRDDRHPGDVTLFCVCPPSDDVYDCWEAEGDDDA